MINENSLFFISQFSPGIKLAKSFVQFKIINILIQLLNYLGVVAKLNSGF